MSLTRNAGSAKLKLLQEAYRPWSYLDVYVCWAVALRLLGTPCVIEGPCKAQLTRLRLIMKVLVA